MHLIRLFVLLGATIVGGSAAQAYPLVSFETPTSMFAGLIVQSGFKCDFVNGKLVCGNKKSDAQDSEDDDDDDDQLKKSKDKVIPKTCGKKVRCEPGFVVLEKPNKYGACCEAREGLPPPKAAEPEKCKFPGEVGTPPNCSCPPATEFLGYKGCVSYTYQEAYCINPTGPGGGFNNIAADDLAKKCKAEGGYGECKTKERCCCNKKIYAQ